MLVIDDVILVAPLLSIMHPQVDSLSNVSPSSATDKVVAFTCGHHYTSEQSYLIEIDKFASSLEDGGKVNTALTYKQIYQEEPATGWSGTIQAACPKCVHGLIAQTSESQN